MHLVYTIITLFFTFTLNVFANPDVYYFTENDGENHIFYKAFCANTGRDGMCSLKTISVRNAKSTLKCGISVDELYPWGEAKKSGDTWLISSSAGGCGYTNTYQISNTGMIQVKSSPKKKKLEVCEVFEPKTYIMKYHKDVSTIELSVEGCKNLNVLSID